MKGGSESVVILGCVKGGSESVVILGAVEKTNG